MAWEVVFHPAFEAEYGELPGSVRDQLEDRMELLRQQGPSLGRPRADTLRGSRHPNMKELRLTVDGGGWRILFASDPGRQAVLLLAGSKKSGTERQFYRQVIREADARFDDHLSRLRG